MASFGLYLGTSNFCIAMHKDGETEVLANVNGDRVTPSMVSYVDGQKYVATSAKHGRLGNASNIISFVKRFIGDGEMNIKNQHSCTCKIVNEGGFKFQVDDGSKVKNFSLHEILVFFFQHMLDIGKSRFQSSHNIYPSVVTVPYHFSEEMKMVLRDSAVEAGFDVLRLITEPAAAAYAYKIGQESNDCYCKLVIFRVGGTSMDVTILEVIGGMYRIASHIRKEHLGGDSINKCLVDYCCEEFQRQYKVNITENKRAMGKIWNGAEMCKLGLTKVDTYKCYVESVHDGIDLSLNISRARFEALIGSTVLQCLEPIDIALAEASITKDLIQKVILVGGSTKIALVQRLLRDKFGNAEVIFTLPPDEILALGAAEEASLLHGKEKHEIKDVEVLSNTIYLKVQKKEASYFYAVLKKGSPVPTKWHQSFHIPSEQSSLVLDIYEEINSEHEPERAVPLAKVVFQEVENSEVVIYFQFGNDSSLHITCTNKSSNKTESVTVECGNR